MLGVCGQADNGVGVAASLCLCGACAIHTLVAHRTREPALSEHCYLHSSIQRARAHATTAHARLAEPANP